MGTWCPLVLGGRVGSELDQNFRSKSGVGTNPGWIRPLTTPCVFDFGCAVFRMMPAKLLHKAAETKQTKLMNHWVVTG